MITLGGRENIEARERLLAMGKVVALVEWEMKEGGVDRMRGWIGNVAEVLLEVWREVWVERGIGRTSGVGRRRMNGGMGEEEEEEIVCLGRQEITSPGTLT